MTNTSKLLRDTLNIEKPLQIVGTINAYTALLAQQAGFKALYLSGAGVANASYGLPDIGITTLNDVLEDARRIVGVTNLPLLVDVDTGWGAESMIARMVKSMIQAGVAAIHMEDQVFNKRCGHLIGKKIVPVEEMQNRIKAAVDARTNDDFVIMARTDAIESEGVEGAIDRARAYVEVGADMIFAEAMTDLDSFAKFVKDIPVPVLANMTEYGKTHLYSLDEFKSVGIAMVLYPLSAFRAMNKAASQIYQTIRTKGTQKDLIERMETREELYSNLNYQPTKNKS